MMIISGMVKSVNVREYDNGRSFTYDVMDDTVGRLRLTYYPNNGENPLDVDALVNFEIREVRVWKSQNGRPGLSLIVDKIISVN